MTETRAPHQTGLFRSHPNPDLRVLSLGAGVQSTCLALMAAHGEIGPMPDIAVFADTGWEPKSVYENLKWLMSPNVLPFPVIVANLKAPNSSGNIRTDLVDRIDGRKSRVAAIPFFSVGPDGKAGMGRRQCTREYKIGVIQSAIRKHLGIRRIVNKTIEVWKGISLDEIGRCAPSRASWEFSRWPLIEERMRRYDCIMWLRRHEYPVPPKSSCIGCPFHNNAHWREMKENAPDEFEDACQVDEIIRDGERWGFKYQQYMHRSCKPLREVDFSEPDNGQGDWMAECEGMCGL